MREEVWGDIGTRDHRHMGGSAVREGVWGEHRDTRTQTQDSEDNMGPWTWRGAHLWGADKM